MHRSWLLVSTALWLLPAGLFAGTQDGVSVSLHIQAHAVKAIQICDTATPNAQGLVCEAYQTQWPTHAPGDLYLVVTTGDPGPGIAGLSCGIAYPPNLSMSGWELCADLEFPNGSWPASGGGNRITWAAGVNCQTTVIPGYEYYGVHAVAGAFYVYAYGSGLFEITDNLGIAVPELKVADCNASESDVNYLPAKVGFGVAQGYNACVLCKPGCSPVERTTWGALKTGYR